MIRGKKVNSNRRVYLQDGVIIGGIELHEGQSYVLVGKAAKRIEISYQLKKDIRDYNQQYITRVMRKLFLAQYNKYQSAKVIRKEIKEYDQKQRVERTANQIEMINSLVCEKRALIAQMNSINIHKHLSQLEQGHPSEFQRIGGI